MSEMPSTSESLSPREQQAIFNELILVVYRYAGKLGAPSADAEEIAGEAVHRVLQKLTRHPSLVRCRTLYSIAVCRRVFLEWLRKQKQPAGSVKVGTDGTELGIGHKPADFELAEIIERHRAELYEGLSQRQLWILEELGRGRCALDLARELQMEPGAFRTELSRANAIIARNVARIVRRYYD